MIIGNLALPVFNADNFLLQSLDSIFNQQTSASIEVIAIDNASSDDSWLILEDYISREPRVKVIKHETNQGPAVARANGMKLARGHYIMHVDADDYLVDGAIEKLHSKSIEFDVDVIIYNYLLKDSVNNEFKGYNIEKELVTSNKHDVKMFFYNNSATKLVKRDLVLDMIVGNEKFTATSEDLLYCTEIFIRAKTFYLCADVLYIARLHDASYTAISWDSELVLKNRVATLIALNQIILNNHYDVLVVDNVLSKIERTILEYSFVYKFTVFKKAREFNDLKGALRLFKKFKQIRLRSIELSLNSRFFSCYNVIKYTGFKNMFHFVKVIIVVYLRRFRR